MAMEIAVFPDTHNFFTNHPALLPLSTSPGNLQIAALQSPIDAVAPPPVRSTTSSRASTRTLLKRRRSRTRRRPRSSGGSQDDGLLGGGGDDGTFGGSGGGGGWNFDGFGGFGWDDDSSSSPPDPAFDFVYEVVCWLLLSNCLHFAFKKVARLIAEGFPAREKVPMRLASIC